ncbi:MAG: hypothetical protein ABIG68_04465 [Acidobacteriota bacterium]
MLIRFIARFGFFAVFSALLAGFAAERVSAQEGGFGIRAGASVDPDQFHVGGHFESGPLVRRLTFRPNMELGFGDHVATVAFNLEFAYHLPLQRSDWSVYFGAGPALNIFNFDDDFDGRGRRSGTEAEGGFNILVGLQHDRGLFGELKVGALDSPDLKITVGFTFR